MVVKIYRRNFIASGTMLLTAAAFPNSTGIAQEKEAMQETQEEVTPSEDLMREHGVLDRVLLIYDEIVRRLNSGSIWESDVVIESAGIIKKFIEDYHEKLEEDFLFPRFEKAGKHADLVKVLRTQHQAGRQVTASILQIALDVKTDQQKQMLAKRLAMFARMYRPHSSREDTVLFPAFREIVSAKEWGSLGEQFEEKEHALFGKTGFRGIVDQVSALEEKLGLFDLAQYTPKLD